MTFWEIEKNACYQHVLRYHHPNDVHGQPTTPSATPASGVSGYECCGFTTGELLEGNIPAKKLRLVQAWIAIHEDELMADWALAVKSEPIFPIEPLR